MFITAFRRLFPRDYTHYRPRRARNGNVSTQISANLPHKRYCPAQPDSKKPYHGGLATPSLPGSRSPEFPAPAANSRIFNALGAARAVYYCLFNVPESSGKAIIGRLAGFKRVAKPIRNRAGATPPKVAYLKPWLILLGPRKIEGSPTQHQQLAHFPKHGKKPLMIIIKSPKSHEKIESVQLSPTFTIWTRPD